MASRSVRGSIRAAVLRPSQAANHPRAVGTDAAPKTRTREPVLVRGQGRLVEGVGDVGAKEADLVRSEVPEELNRIRDDVRQPWEGNALALAGETVGEGTPD
eukprot:2631185-Alexandrium_andersonii.AAC.1